MLNIQYKEGSTWGCPNTPLVYLVIFIYVYSIIFIHFHICTNLLLLPSVSILLSLFYQSRSLFPLLLFFLPPASSYLSFHVHTNAPDASLSLHPSLLFSLSPLRSLSAALMNCLPLPVNSTDNPGEAVKDHRSALQTGPQATAQEQHANNKPLHLALSVCICVHVCTGMHMFVHVFECMIVYMYCTLNVCMLNVGLTQ